MTGRVTFDAQKAIAPPDKPDVVRLTLTSAPPSTASNETTGASFNGMTTLGRVHADGTLEFDGLLPGRYAVTAVVLGDPRWRAQSFIVNGQDALDVPLVVDANGGDITDAALTFSDRHTEIAGTLQTSAGAPASDYFVVAFPADRALWDSAARRMIAVRPASDGHFSIADLPPGRYLMAALADVDQDDWHTPDALAAIAPHAIPLTLGDGETKTQDIRIVQ